MRWRDETNPRPVPASPGRRNSHLILWISSLLFRFLLSYHAPCQVARWTESRSVVIATG